MGEAEWGGGMESLSHDRMEPGIRWDCQKTDMTKH